MRALRTQAHWMIALIGGFCLVAAAVSVAQRPSLPASVVAQDAHELSTVFRSVAAETLPCVVTIETRQNAREIADNEIPDQLDEFFRADPRLREFFRRMPRQTPPQQGMGSGFIIDASGIIATNNHVVADADEIVVRLHDGREFRGTEVKTDARTDIAILRFDAGGPLPTLKFGDSDGAQIGDWVIAVGNPFGHELTVTSGIISAKGRGPGIAEREDFLQTDAAINPGNSGGPLLNLHGDVIGVNTAISSRSGGFDGIGFAVPSRMALWVVNQLVEKGRVTRAYIGISIQQISSDLAKQLRVRVGEGAIVTQVLPESPGAKASLTQGDVVLSLNGSQVTSPRSLQGIVEKLELDKEYTVEILRDGDRKRLPIVLQEMPNDYTLARVMGRPQRERREEADDRITVEDFGFEVQEITPELAEQLKVEADSGVVVSSVDGDGKANGKLRAGDVIEKVGNEAVKGTDEFNAALKNADLKKGLLLLVRTGDATRFEVLR